jgi:Mn2+/Fe2+ NRAMP family transporter
MFATYYGKIFGDLSITILVNALQKRLENICLFLLVNLLVCILYQLEQTLPLKWKRMNSNKESLYDKRTFS